VASKLVRKRWASDSVDLGVWAGRLIHPSWAK